MDAHSLRPEEAMKRLRTSENGLSSKEAEARLLKYGLNELATEKKVNPVKILISQFASPLILMLIAAAMISYSIGYLQGDGGHDTDAILILAIVALNGAMGFIQDYKAEKSIEALRKMTSPSARVIRDGRSVLIKSSEIVPGDIVRLGAGDIVPADARIISASGLKVNESALTGESLDAKKSSGTLPFETQSAERINMAYMNTWVTEGSAVAVITDTGKETVIGKLASKMQEIKPEKTHFQKELSSLSGKIGLLTIAVAVVMFIITFGAQGFLESFKTSVSLAVAAIPEGLPAVVTISLTLGARVMASKKALIRRLPVVENIGSVDVICTDKTGTITENRMKVRELFASFRKFEGKLAPDFRLLLKCGAVCNNAEKSGGEFSGGQTEVALISKSSEHNIDISGIRRIREFPFSSGRKMMSLIVEESGKRMLYSKGAPEMILERCSYVLEGGKETKLTEEKKKRILSENGSLASKGLRVLAFAYKESGTKEEGLVFIGFQGLSDPPRKGVSDAIAECREAGIDIIMITGDNAETAKAIASEVGIDSRFAVTGAELDSMTDTELSKAVETVKIFARVSPEHKLRILDALKAKGKNVAMTGDGVNDSLALKRADVGISMGLRGTEVAKEAGDIILTDDNFSDIKNAVREGRRVFINIRKFVIYLLSCNLAEVMIIFSAALLLGVSPLLAGQILWINLLTDGFPALALGLDPAANGIMKGKPAVKGGIIGRKTMSMILLIGIVVSVSLLAVYFYSIERFGPAVASTMVFTGIVLYEFVWIPVIRGIEKTKLFSNRWLAAAMAFSFALQLAAIYTPLSGVLNTVPLSLDHWAVLLAGLVPGVVLALGYSKIVERINLKINPKTLNDTKTITLC